MGREIPLGRIAGIKVTMDVTVLLVAGFYSWVLATNRFPIQSPGLSTSTYWVAGISFALLFFVSLLVHEIGHALVAKDEGIGVVGISLWLLGGMARLETSPTTARSEFRIAVVGPLASAACGVVFLVGAYLAPTSGIGELVGHLLALLGLINLVLAVFNILPAAPLDGGTVLSSLIWSRTGSHAQGVRWSAYAGLATGGLMIYGGLRAMQSADSRALDGIGLLVVGGFIAFAAFRSVRAYPLFDLLDGLHVREAMSPAAAVTPGWQPVASAAAGMALEGRQQLYPVIDGDGQVTGLLSTRAVAAVDPARRHSIKVSDLAYPLERLTILSADDHLLSGLQRLDGGDAKLGLVVDATGTVVGTIEPSVLHRVVERRRAELTANPT
jgi:Zn-dependent protease